MELLAISKDTAIRELNNLIENKLIKREGTGRSVRYVAYWCDAKLPIDIIILVNRIYPILSSGDFFCLPLNNIPLHRIKNNSNKVQRFPTTSVLFSISFLLQLQKRTFLIFASISLTLNFKLKKPNTIWGLNRHVYLFHDLWYLQVWPDIHGLQHMHRRCLHNTLQNRISDFSGTNRGESRQKMNWKPPLAHPYPLHSAGWQAWPGLQKYSLFPSGMSTSTEKRLIWLQYSNPVL